MKHTKSKGDIMRKREYIIDELMEAQFVERETDWVYFRKG